MKRQLKFEGLDLDDIPLMKQAYIQKESQSFVSYILTSLRTRKDDRFGSIIMDIDRTARGSLTQLRDARREFSVGEIGQDEIAMVNIQKVGEAFYSTMNASAPVADAGGIYGAIMNAIISSKLYIPLAPPTIEKGKEKTKEEVVPTVGSELSNNLRVLDKKISEQLGKIKSIIDVGEFTDSHLDEEEVHEIEERLLGVQSKVNTMLPSIDDSKDNTEQKAQFEELDKEYQKLSSEFEGLSKSSEMIFQLYGIITKTANSDPRKATAQYLRKLGGIVDTILETRIPEVRPGVRIQEWKHDLEALKGRALERTDPLRERRILARRAINILVEKNKDFIRAVEASSGKKTSDIEEKARWNRIIDAYNSFATDFNANLQIIRTLGTLGAGRSIQHGIRKKELKDKKQDLMELPSAAMRSFKYVLPVAIPLINVKL